MTHRLARLAAPVMIALAFAGVAYAKPSPPMPVKPPVNEAARMEAEKLIGSIGGQDLFANETRDGAILIRHRASNFQCLFNPGSPNSLLVTTTAPRGEEVGCDGPTMDFQTTYFITRAGPGDTLDSQFKEAVAEVKARWPKAMTIKVAEEPGQDLLAKLAASAPPNKTTWLLAKTNRGGWAFTRVSVAKAGEWLITMRAAGPVEVQDSAESLTEMLWLTRLMVMVDPTLASKPMAQAGQKKR
jgi:hypothetical protein